VTLELDHVFCMVGNLDEVASRVENAGLLHVLRGEPSGLAESVPGF